MRAEPSTGRTPGCSSGAFPTLSSIDAPFDEPFVRAWRLYLTASAATFRTGGLQPFQVVLARGHSSATDWTHARAYAPAEAQ